MARLHYLSPVAVIDTLVNYARCHTREITLSRTTVSRRIAKFVAISREYAVQIYDSTRERATPKIPDSVKISRTSHSSMRQIAFLHSRMTHELDVFLK